MEDESISQTRRSVRAHEEDEEALRWATIEKKRKKKKPKLQQVHWWGLRGDT